MKRSEQNKAVVADFFAHGYRVSGTLAATGRTLPDIVYDPSTNYVPIQEAYLSPITTPTKISAYYASAVLTKVNLDFIITMDVNDGLRRDQHYTLGKNVYNISLTLPFFEIQGELHSLNRNFDARVFLSSDAAGFITLLNAKARCTFNPDVSYEGGATLVSRNKISFLGETRTED